MGKASELINLINEEKRKKSGLLDTKDFSKSQKQKVAWKKYRVLRQIAINRYWRRKQGIKPLNDGRRKNRSKRSRT